MKNPLELSPLPTLRANEDPGSLLMEREGFVDEAVVATLRVGPGTTSRRAPCPDDLALAADDLDFASWSYAKPQATRKPEVPPQVIAAIVRRAAPPSLGEPGIGSPHRGNHRWWLAGLAGVTCTTLVAALLLSLSSRPGLQFQAILPPRVVEKFQPVPTPKVPETKTTPELTDASRP